MEHLSENSFGSLIPGLGYRKLKRLADLMLCLLALPVAGPLMLGAALLIKLEGKGPILFCQQRMGYKGKWFKVCKFRTMTTVHDGSDRASSMTQSEDSRITPLGHFLRRTRIDELPQIWNIVRGEMSWIGPRPEAISLSNWYEGELAFYRYRHIVRPGITGWAQVNQGHVCSLSDVDHKLQFDFYYIKNISYWMDILILMKTVRVVLTGFGAK
jgi:lipopolysaccharide/colanic/teichoic acid biosynthesis glycosyltransferase